MLALVGSLVFTSDAHAWGVGMHLSLGLKVLESLQFIAPAIAEVLRAFPHDFLYGSISADIFIGKGQRQRSDHCHNWSVGHQLFSLSAKNSECAFAFGYLTHLAADVIAHNFYIPNQLYLTPTTKRLGHIYWEHRSDVFIRREVWGLAKKVVRSHSPICDLFLIASVKNRGLPFKAKKKIYCHTINFFNLKKWQNTVRRLSKNSRWEVCPEYIYFLHDLSFNLILDFFDRGKDAVCLRFDPVGTENLKFAKRMRKTIKRIERKNPEKNFFDIPDTILSLAHKKDSFELTKAS